MVFLQLFFSLPSLFFTSFFSGIAVVLSMRSRGRLWSWQQGGQAGWSSVQFYILTSAGLLRIPCKYAAALFVG